MILDAIHLAACGTATPVPTATATTVLNLTPIIPYQTSQELETPLLIQLSFDRGEITNEQRLLYLAYALYEPGSLPLQFRSNYGWFGEMAQYELEVLTDPSVFCSMSPYARSEFQRLHVSNITCERNLLSPVLAGILIIAFIAVFYIRKQQSQKSSDS